MSREKKVSKPEKDKKAEKRHRRGTKITGSHEIDNTGQVYR